MSIRRETNYCQTIYHIVSFFSTVPTLPRVGTANLYHFLALCLLCKEWIRQNPHFLIVPCLHCKEWIRPIQSQETSTAPSLSGEWMRHFLNHYRLAPRPPFQTRVDAACSSQGQFDTASFCEAVYLNICQFVPSSVGGSRLFEHLLSTTPVCKEGCGRLIIIIAESTFCPVELLGKESDQNITVRKLHLTRQLGLGTRASLT